jgi:hypothetical protein
MLPAGERYACGRQSYRIIRPEKHLNECRVFTPAGVTKPFYFVQFIEQKIQTGSILTA